MQEIILSFIQGVTEFLPVSSSAHLIAANHYFNIKEPARLLEVVFHLGTLATVLIYFSSSVFRIASGFFMALQGKASAGFTEFLKIILGSLPVIIFGYFIHQFTPQGINSLSLLGWMSIIMGIILITVDIGRMHYKTYYQLTFKDAFIIGCFQSVALFPGVSRLGASLIGARILGYQRSAAAKFSFLLSIPAVLGANTLVGYGLYKEGLLNLNQDIFLLLILTCLIGLISLFFFMKWIKTSTLQIFGVYRILFGICLLVL